MSHSFILDIGKTNIKALVLDERGDTCWSRSRANSVIDEAPYPHFPVEEIWSWLKSMLGQAAREYALDAINVSTHGACAVLLDGHGELVLPVLDYEYSAPESEASAYHTVRPDFEITQSPGLPAGLNLGRQLWWQKHRFPAAFARIASVLCYPQYWVWKLCGTAVNERTSLGCHTDLWSPRDNDYSPLVDHLALRHALPPLVDTREWVGEFDSQLAGELGMAPGCRIYAGVHDSNASFARYLASGLREPFTVVSTGTWFVLMARGDNNPELLEHRDMLANVDVCGQALPCARFMGGREFEMLCNLLHREQSSPCPEVTERDICDTVAAGAMAMPGFAGAGGPFAGIEGRVSGTPASPASLATLYLALMVDYELDLLGAEGDVVFGSLSQKNPLLCGLLAALRPENRVLLSGDEGSTHRGAWCLTRWEAGVPREMTRFDPVEPRAVPGLAAYRREWREAVTKLSP